MRTGGPVSDGEKRGWRRGLGGGRGGRVKGYNEVDLLVLRQAGGMEGK